MTRPLQVQHRAARVAGVDGRVGLDRLADELVVLRAFDHPPQRADHAGRQRPLQAIGVADGDDELAHPQLARIAQDERRRQIDARRRSGARPGRSSDPSPPPRPRRPGRRPGSPGARPRLRSRDSSSRCGLRCRTQTPSRSLPGERAHEAVVDGAAVGDVHHRRAGRVIDGDDLRFQGVGGCLFVEDNSARIEGQPWPLGWLWSWGELWIPASVPGLPS